MFAADDGFSVDFLLQISQKDQISIFFIPFFALSITL